MLRFLDTSDADTMSLMTNTSSDVIGVWIDGNHVIRGATRNATVDINDAMTLLAVRISGRRPETTSDLPFAASSATNDWHLNRRNLEVHHGGTGRMEEPGLR